jgi:hypothetical protein
MEEEDLEEEERRRSKKSKKRRRKEESMTGTAVAGEGPSFASPAGAGEVEDPSKPKKKRGRPPIDKSLMPSKHVKKQMKKIMEMVKHYTDR